MTNKDATCAYYLSDLGKLLKERAQKAKSARDSADAASQEFENGHLHAYYAVVSHMQNQALAFGLTFEDVGLDGIDPDKDLI